MKWCSKCKETFPIHNFYKNGKYTSSQCKACTLKRSKEWWAKATPDEKREKNRLYTVTYREGAKLSPQEAWLRRVTCIQSKTEIWGSRTGMRDLIRPLIVTHCPLLGIELTYTPSGMGVSKYQPNYATLDRKDNTKGYVEGNLWVISLRANVSKRDMNISELQQYAINILRCFPKVSTY